MGGCSFYSPSCLFSCTKSCASGSQQGLMRWQAASPRVTRECGLSRPPRQGAGRGFCRGGSWGDFVVFPEPGACLELSHHKSPDLCPSEASRLPAPGWDRGASLKRARSQVLLWDLFLKAQPRSKSSSPSSGFVSS